MKARPATMLAQSLTVLAAITGIAASPLAPLASRAVIDHDAVVGFGEAVPSGAVGNAYLRFKPRLEVVNGCVPFPAVDAEGNTSGGLATSGSSNGGCSSSPGQVYGRIGQRGDMWGLMYSWYMPKDSPSDGLGHRHDWEGIVVWVDDANAAEPTILGLAASAHGNFDVRTSGFHLDGTRPLIRYFSVWPVNHQLGFTDDVGGEQPLVTWETLTAAARDALQNTDFGDATVPFKDGSFEANLEAASF